ncbi:MAG TPA: GNAT family N-acetyltransferase [Anaerolineales bacterium]|nr:GNAT family N-acetyltransferase [Anaerolineales bacterium]
MAEVEGIPGYSKEEVIHQVELNLWETWSNFGRGPGCTLHDEDDALWFETPIPIIPYNSVVRFQVEQDVDKRIDELVQGYAERKVAPLWIVHPSSVPTDLPERLQKRGYQEIEIAPCMARSLEIDLSETPPIPDGVEIREAIDKKDVMELYGLAAWRWGVPDDYRPHLKKIIEEFKVGEHTSNTRFWLAWKDGVPISKAALYSGSGSAGIYAVATRPEARGLGIASILVNVALKAAQEMGHKLAVLDASPLAEKLYQRLGFITVAPLRLYSPVEGHI